MKKLLFMLLFGAFIFVFQGVNLFADDFSECLDLERLKAKSDGVTAKESVDQAERIYKLKFPLDLQIPWLSLHPILLSVVLNPNIPKSHQQKDLPLEKQR